MEQPRISTPLGNWTVVYIAGTKGVSLDSPEVESLVERFKIRRIGFIPLGWSPMLYAAFETWQGAASFAHLTHLHANDLADGVFLVVSIAGPAATALPHGYGLGDSLPPEWAREIEFDSMGKINQPPRHREVQSKLRPFLYHPDQPLALSGSLPARRPPPPPPPPPPSQSISPRPRNTASSSPTKRAPRSAQVTKFFAIHEDDIENHESSQALRLPLGSRKRSPSHAGLSDRNLNLEKTSNDSNPPIARSIRSRQDFSTDQLDSSDRRRESRPETLVPTEDLETDQTRTTDERRLSALFSVDTEFKGRVYFDDYNQELLNHPPVAETDFTPMYRKSFRVTSLLKSASWLNEADIGESQCARLFVGSLGIKEEKIDCVAMRAAEYGVGGMDIDIIMRDTDDYCFLLEEGIIGKISKAKRLWGYHKTRLDISIDQERKIRERARYSFD
ncbi:hypothetical protein JCM3765_002040 [Sporobolomyces pararoseus]